jgi:hypothetical protein
VIVIFIVLSVLVRATVKILREYERGVIFTLGRFQTVKGLGLIVLIPFVQEMVRVDPEDAIIKVQQYLPATAMLAQTTLHAVPAAMQLRYPQTLTEIGAEQNSTVTFPTPLDVIKPLLALLETKMSAPPAIALRVGIHAIP